MPTQGSGFGGRLGNKSARTSGKQNIVDRADNGSLCLNGHLSDFIIIKRELNDSESNRLSLAFSIA